MYVLGRSIVYSKKENTSKIRPDRHRISDVRVPKILLNDRYALHVRIHTCRIHRGESSFLFGSEPVRRYVIHILRENHRAFRLKLPLIDGFRFGARTRISRVCPRASYGRVTRLSYILRRTYRDGRKLH